jgi:DNA-directed RNA polymerase beta' subunit
MNNDTREVDQITFGVYSAEEIKKLAVCEITSSKICSSDREGSIGTVYDPRLGTLENDKLCETCKLGVWQCNGHIGYIQLNEPILHPLYYKEIVNFLEAFCIKCHKLLISKDQILLNGFNKIKGEKRFVKILEKLKKIEICSECSQPQPTIKYSAVDNSISLVYKKKDKIKVSIGLTVDEIKKIFDNILDTDMELIGYDPSLMHPRNLVETVFPVIPPNCRPYVITDGNICDDDLTIQLIEIIKANNHLKIEEGASAISETKRQKYIQSLKFRISTFYNNSQGRAKHTTNGRSIKGIKERLTGKEGLLRSNLMGKFIYLSLS